MEGTLTDRKYCMELDEIKNIPRVMYNVHESALRSYHMLDLVLVMIERGDSKETISMVVTFLWKDSK